MLLTKDNLLKFIKEKKAVTPVDVSNFFSTTTLVASAALSQLVDEGFIKVSSIKFGSSSYYYDINNKEYLQELAKKHFSKNDLEIFKKIKNKKIINDNSLTPAEKIAISRIKDFAIPVEIEFKNSILKFWIWYLLDVEKTKKEIINALKELDNKNNKIDNEKSHYEEKKDSKTVNKNIDKKNYKLNNFINNESNEPYKKNIIKKYKLNNKISKKLNDNKENFDEDYIENFFIKHNFKILSKNNNKNVIEYELLFINNSNFNIQFSARFYIKKPTENEIIKFYVSDNKPKIIFCNKLSNRIKNLEKSLENIFIFSIDN